MNNNRGGLSHPPGKFHMRGSKTYTPRHGGNFQQQTSPQQVDPTQQVQQQQQTFDPTQPIQQQQQQQTSPQHQSQTHYLSKFGKPSHRSNHHNGSNGNPQQQQQQQPNITSPGLNSTNTNSRGGYRGSSRGGRGGRGGRGAHRGQSTFYTSSYQKTGPRLLTSIVSLPPFSGGAIIGVKGSLWGLLNKATTARLKVSKDRAIIKCADAQQLDRAKEIVLKLKNTSPKYLSLIDYKGEQKIKFVHQPNFSEVVLESGVIDSNDIPAMQELINGQEVQYVNRLNETFSTLHSDKDQSKPIIDVETGKIWYLHSSNIPSTPMTSDKYELYTESLASVFQPSSVITEGFISNSNFKLYKQKKPHTYISVLDTESLDLLCIKCSEEKVSTPSTSAPSSSESPNVEYKFTNPILYKLTHVNSSKILFPQIKSGSDLRLTIDTQSKSKLTNDNLLKFVEGIKIFKNTSGNNTYQVPDSNLFIVESIITRKVSIYRTDDNTLQFQVNDETATRYTTSNPEVNRQSTSIVCTSPALYDLFKSKNWTVEQATVELKKLSKNIRSLVSKYLDASKFAPPTTDAENFQNLDNDEEDEE